MTKFEKKVMNLIFKFTTDKKAVNVKIKVRYFYISR